MMYGYNGMGNAFGNGFCSFGGGSRFFMGHGIGGVLLGLLALIVVVAIVVYLIKRPSQTLSVNNNHSEALSILNNRFASGEITEEEYNQKRSLILKK